MAVQQQRAATAAVQPVPPQRTGWLGWIAFAGIMMMVLGTFHGIAGLTALFNDEYYLVRPEGLVVEVDYTAWGWLHLALGAVLVGAGASLFVGNMFGRVIGVIVATLSAIANLAFIASYPVWSVVMIAIDVLVIYAIVVHGREAAD
jgi:hypothetical protein